MVFASPSARTSRAVSMVSFSIRPPPTVPKVLPLPRTSILAPDLRGEEPLWATTVASTNGSPCRVSRTTSSYSSRSVTHSPLFHCSLDFIRRHGQRTQPCAGSGKQRVGHRRGNWWNARFPHATRRLAAVDNMYFHLRHGLHAHQW